jgi:hypothetical protein
MNIPKTIWFAKEYAVYYCRDLSCRSLRRRLHENGKAKWATFYCAKTLQAVWSCNAEFAAEHFYRQRK